MEINVIQHIEAAEPTLPKQQRTLCAYVRSNLIEASMLTIPQMAEKAGVATATVVRTVQALGFSSFSAFKAELKKSALLSVGSSYSSYVKAQDAPLRKSGSADEYMLWLLGQSENALHSMQDPAFIAKLLNAVDMLFHAKRIYTLALRSSSPIIASFQCLLHNPSIPVTELHRKPSMLFDNILQMTAQDILLTCASHPVTRQVSEAMHICHDRSVPVILVTNTSDAPMSRYADLVIDVSEGLGTEYSISQPSAALYMVMELLANSLARRYAAIQSFSPAEQLDQLAQEYHLDLWDI